MKRWCNTELPVGSRQRDTGAFDAAFARHRRVLAGRICARCGAGRDVRAGRAGLPPENVEIGDDVYVGHQAILKGYYKNRLVDRRRAAGSGSSVSCTPPAASRSACGSASARRARILTSTHELPGRSATPPIMDGALRPCARWCSRTAATSAWARSSCPASPSGAARRSAPARWSRATCPAGAIAAGVPARIIGPVMSREVRRLRPCAFVAYVWVRPAGVSTGSTPASSPPPPSRSASRTRRGSRSTPCSASSRRCCRFGEVAFRLSLLSAVAAALADRRARARLALRLLASRRPAGRSPGRCSAGPPGGARPIRGSRRRGPRSTRRWRRRGSWGAVFGVRFSRREPAPARRADRGAAPGARRRLHPLLAAAHRPRPAARDRHPRAPLAPARRRAGAARPRREPAPAAARRRRRCPGTSPGRRAASSTRSSAAPTPATSPRRHARPQRRARGAARRGRRAWRSCSAARRARVRAR